MSFQHLFASWFKAKQVKPKKEPAHLTLAKSLIGTLEWKDGDNPVVVQMFADIGHSWVKDDETAWCAAFSGSCLEKSDIPSTRALNARSYLDWGRVVDLENAKPGDIVVFWRGTPDGWQGHVGFYLSHTSTHIKVLGGNQKDQVCIADYSREQFLGVRRHG